jgi:hypothetical protein
MPENIVMIAVAIIGSIVGIGGLLFGLYKHIQGRKDKEQMDFLDGKKNTEITLEELVR